MPASKSSAVVGQWSANGHPPVRARRDQSALSAQAQIRVGKPGETMTATPQGVSIEANHTPLRARDQQPPASEVNRRPRFFLVMSAIFLAIAVVGFIPTFFAPLVTGHFSRPPVYYIHAVAFFGWVVFYFSQNLLIYQGRVLAHREWGVMGAALAAAMVFSVLILDVVEINQKTPLDVLPTIITWAGVSLMTMFVVCVAAGLANVRRPEVHKRFMLIATMGLLGAPIARWPVTFAPHTSTGTPSIWVPLTLIPATLMLYAAVMIYDKTRAGRISRVYIFGLVAGLALAALGAPLAATPLWQSVTSWMKGLAG
jgi:hypothetical protein